MKLNRKLAATLVTTGLAAALTPLTASSASAASMHGCSYPRVCVYEGSYSGGSVIGWFQDTYYQNMPTAIQNDPDAVVNTRNDDSVWLLDTRPSPDAYICIPKNTAVNLGNYDHPTNDTTWANDVDTIKIWGDPDTGTCSGTLKVQQGRVPDGWRP
ncbi:hypothetical protein [Streptomyces hawaiiensis]|jgi:hypothetical protein|uniref:Peptidase inhibitor family I36 n=1 Tax=Streptomyces hawaiiensis TaxID=67305 RepID=A0A6G5RQ45_9ACTN|nr:hypothetical protein [Streptomyces hawaiiensis]QCD60285.1 hypothetical protein CEB94_40275 [Streptomyces hawaiiensis]